VSGLYTEVRGSGPTLVLLHGWGLNVRVWDGLAAALCDRFRIIVVDLPGHGRSGWVPDHSSLQQQAEEIHATVAAIAADYFLLGWSLGGQIALQLAATHTAVRRLVLIATTPRLVAAPDWPHGVPPERLAAQAEGLRTDYRRTVSDFLELQVRGSAGGAAALAQLNAALFAHGSGEGALGPRLAALARDLELLHDTDLRPLLADVTVPTLVVAGQYDRVTLPAASHALADSLPDARYVEIHRAAHAPFLSHLPELSSLVADFLLRT
jgi:pimeloyl-[acyl-carrier protein] methyl ester esterase